MTEVVARRLRLAQVVTRMDIGGVPDHVRTLIAELHDEFDISLVCGEIDDQHRDALQRMNVDIHIIPFRRLLSLGTDIKTFRALLKLFRTQRYDVVHTHMSKAALIGSSAAMWARIPVIVNTAHNLGFIALPRRVLRGLFWLYDFMLFRATMDAVITVSAKVRNRIVETRLFPSARVFSVHNGIDLAKMSVSADEAKATRRALGGAPDEVLIVSVARLVWFKGLDTLVAAMPALLTKCPKVRIVIAGEGPLRAELAAQAKALGVADRFIMVGERRDVPALLAAADIFVLPSVSEGLPISIMEAMASGKPVVATDVGGVAELVADKQTGFLVPAQRPELLADALSKFAADPGLRAGMGNKGLERISTEFSAGTMAKRTAEIYRTIFAKSMRRV